MNNPYIDRGNIRVFLRGVNEEYLVWHRDREDRTIRVIESEGWSFQYEDCLPFVMYMGDEFEVPAMVYHRIIKHEDCRNNLVLSIERS